MSDFTGDQWMNIGMSILAALACGVFALVYHLRATWWRSEIGRNQMLFAATVAALCLYTVAATIWQNDVCVLLILRSVRTLVLMSVAALMVQRTRLFLKAQREAHRTEAKDA